MSLYNFAAARGDDQLQKMKDLDSQGICIFCPEHIHEDSEKILIETKNWMVKKNTYPYEGSSLHLVLIPKEHVSTISQLSKEAKTSFLNLITECEKKFNLKSYAIGIRSGDMQRNGSSIEHLHAHLVEGDTDNPNHEPVRFKMSSRPSTS